MIRYNLKALASRPLPLGPVQGTALDYGNIPVDLTAAASSEPLVVLSSYDVAGSCYYAQADGFNPPFCRAFPSAIPEPVCRVGVAERLAKINDGLRRVGLELYVLDAYRSLACQVELWDFFLEMARVRIPDPTVEACREYAGRYCSDPTNFDPADSGTWPTHSTGGAVDLTLRRISNGQLLFMGGLFDDPSAVSHSSFYEAPPDSIASFESTTTSRRNRRILNSIMTDASFANYRFEWWHYDYGNQMWVANSPPNTEDRFAFYGTIKAPTPTPML